ncbi:MAG: ATP-binding cassette domain-containing protein [Myxococcaceae bacterium]
MIEIDLTLPLSDFDLRVSFSTNAKTIALVGSSGAGKTSVLEAIAGLRRSASGRIAINGRLLQDGNTFLKPEQRGVGYVPQDSALFPHLSVRENVRFGLKSAATFEEAVSLLELGTLLDRRPRTLSAGERQRVALARALATSPSLLLLDEPLANLDRKLRARILPFLQAVRARTSVPLIYVTHAPDEALAMAEEAVVLEHGRVLAHGPASELLARDTVS